MLELLVIVRALALARRGHRELVLENLALRQQLTALRRTTKRAHLPILAGSRFRSPGHLVTIDGVDPGFARKLSPPLAAGRTVVTRLPRAGLSLGRVTRLHG